jgi:hypothetical protein
MVLSGKSCRVLLSSEISLKSLQTGPAGRRLRLVVCEVVRSLPMRRATAGLTRASAATLQLPFFLKVEQNDIAT